MVVESHCEVMQLSHADEAHVSDFLFGPVGSSAGLQVLQCVSTW